MAINKWDKGSLENGPNAYKKGNRTGSERNTEKITALNKRYVEEQQAYREYAEARRNSVKFNQAELSRRNDRLQEYVHQCYEDDEPITRAGMILALGVSRDTYYRMKDGELDYRLYEYMDLNGISESDVMLTEDETPYIVCEGESILLIPSSVMIQKAELQLEAQTEARLYKSGKVGDIFALKAVHGWQEEQSPKTLNQTLVIATPERAREAIAALK